MPLPQEERGNDSDENKEIAHGSLAACHEPMVPGRLCREHAAVVVV